MPLMRAANNALRRFTLQEAATAGITCDVFVSHKSDDKDLALQVFRCIEDSGLVPWIDEEDPAVHGDGPRLGNYIRGIIENSMSLLAVVTDVTQESWWVPFEIGIAFDQSCLLASYAEQDYGLPSFLLSNPRIRDHSQLHNWCTELAVMKATDVLTETASYTGGRVRRANRGNYVNTMSDMARRYR